MTSVRIHIRLTCTVREDVDAHCFVGHCQALDVFSAGNTELEAQAAIKSALTLYVRSLYKQNRLDEKLLTAGFFPVSDSSDIGRGDLAEQFVAVEVGNEGLQRVEIDIPLILAMRAAHAAGEMQPC